MVIYSERAETSWLTRSSLGVAAACAATATTIAAANQTIGSEKQTAGPTTARQPSRGSVKLTYNYEQSRTITLNQMQ